MKYLFLPMAVFVFLSCANETKNKSETCTEKIVLDDKQCMELSGIPDNWKKISLGKDMPGMEISIPPNALYFGTGCYEGKCQIALLLDSTKKLSHVSIDQNKYGEYDGVDSTRKWLLNTSRTCFEFLHDCNKEVILKVRDNGAGIKDNTSFNSFAEKQIGKNRYTMYVDGIIINDVTTEDYLKLTLEDNVNIIKIFRSLK
jgi:hypothetical protein